MLLFGAEQLAPKVDVKIENLGFKGGESSSQFRWFSTAKIEL